MPAPLHGYCGHVSRQNFVNDFARHIREAEVAPLKAGGQPGVVEAKAMQQCGVQIMDGIPGDVESVLIGCSVSDAKASRLPSGCGFFIAAGNPWPYGTRLA